MTRNITVYAINIVFASLVAIGSIFVMPVASAALEAKDTYVRADVGYSYPFKKVSSKYDKKLKSAVLVDVGFGYVIHDRFRTDVTVNYRGKYKYSEVTVAGVTQKQEIDSTAVMVNGYYDFKNFERTTPYMMAGLGVAINEAGDLLRQGASNGGCPRCFGACARSFAWQLGLGASLKINQNFYADLMYKYVDLGRVKNRDKCVGRTTCSNIFYKSKGSLKTHEVSVGVIYKLN